jgi:hypothetical protein
MTATLLALPAAAADLVPPDPWQIIHKVREFGPAEVGRDDFLDPLISAGLAGGEGAAGLPYEVAFYGCSLGRDCSRVLLTLRLSHADWAEAPPDAGQLAEWNATRLIGRAWLDGRNRAVLDHAVIIGPGMPPQTLGETLSAWMDAMREFADFLDFPLN